MSLLSEYPFICNICKCLASSHNYCKLIKILKCVIDRHIKRLLTMSPPELNIFIQILLELINILHSESTIPLDQAFEESVIYNYIQITQLISQHTTLTSLIPNRLQIKLSLQIISIYFDYSRYKNIEPIIDCNIELAAITPQAHFQFIQLILIKCNMINYMSSTCTQNVQPLLTDIHKLITQTLQSKKQTLPHICHLFLRLIQVSLYLRYDQSIEAGQLLIETSNDLFTLIGSINDKNSLENKENHRVGEKRKFCTVEGDQRPRKRQKLNNSHANNSYDSNHIMDGDVCLLVNFCALLNLLWIVRNSSFGYNTNNSSELEELQENIKFLMQKNEADIPPQEMSFFERTLIDFFQQKMEKSSTMTQIHELAQTINGTYFNTQIIKLLARVNPNYNNEDVTDNNTLLSHINWLNIHGLSSIIMQLFKCLEAMHCAKMKDARNCIKNVILVMNSKENKNKKNKNDFARLNLQFLIWNISVHLLVSDEEKLNENMIEIGCMMKYIDTVQCMLNKHYCQQELFENECISNTKGKTNKNDNILQKSVMFLNGSDAPLIVFDLAKNDMKLPSLSLDKLKENESSCFFMQNLINDIENGEILNIAEIKSFLRMTAIKLHYLSAYVSLIIRDRKCTRNQVKRAHRLTIKNVDVSTRFYLRLMLEILKETDLKIKSIYSYIKLIFKQNKNTLNVLPFVAVCTVYAYLVIPDNVVQEFKKKEVNNVDIINTNNNMIRRRITFLKFMICQLLQAPIQAVYVHIICSFLVYLYKLMQQCKEYQFEMQNIEKLLQKLLPKQSEFIDLHFPNCNDLKRINNCCMELLHNQNIIIIPSEINYNSMVDQQLKKVIINYYDHIYIRQSAENSS